MRAHPVSGNSGLPMIVGVLLGEGRGAAAGLAEEEVDGICAGWAAVTSAAWTLGSKKQKERGLALWTRLCSRPVLNMPRGAESAWRPCRARPVLGCSGCITLQLALGHCRGAQTHGGGLGCCTHFLNLSSVLKTNSLEACKILAGPHRLSNPAAVKWCSPLKTHWAHKQTFWKTIFSHGFKICPRTLNARLGPPGFFTKVS